MNDIQKTIVYFIFGCVLIRSSFVLIAKKIDNDKLPYLGYLALIPAFGFAYSYFIKSRDTNMFGLNAWWHNLRIVHSLLYLLFAIYAIQKKEFSYLVLLIDVLIGVISFSMHHFNEGNFSKLFN